MQQSYDHTLERIRFSKPDARLALAYLAVAFTAMLLGGAAGLLQGLERGGMITLPQWLGYYQLLTAHGVLLALVLTTFFIIGFLYAGVARTSGGTLIPVARRLGWSGFILMTLGVLLAGTMILLDEATVLYTFYTPMQASPWFYIGLALLVVGSWLSGAGVFSHYRHWRKTNKGKISPLFAFMAVITFILWIVATLGVATSVVLMIIPWSFGWMDTINVLLTRTLFWYFGHPLVYFWLLPAYMVWYISIPKVIGGKIYSDALARLSFVLFLMFSFPVGFHHQLTEPGVAEGWKFFQVILTMMVVVPSLMTAFSMFATFETTGREKGGTGLFGWVRKLPWKDVRFFAPVMGMLLFIPGGGGGIILASNQLNQAVHNTIFVTGHFHLTVAATVLLTFFGASFWLIPALTNRVLTPSMNRIGMIQTIIWVIGMVLMSGAMHLVGLLGSPRRTSFTTYQDSEVALSWLPYEVVMAIGGVLLFISIVMMFYIVIHLAFFAPRGETDFAIGEVAPTAGKTPRWLERWPVWIGLTVALILVAYTVPVVEMIQNAPPGSPPFRVW